jgi:hypothetical protein
LKGDSVGRRKPGFVGCTNKGLLPVIMSLSDALIFATAWTHVLLAPYTKVEESFNIHATHDVLMYGVGINNLYNVRVRPFTSGLVLMNEPV